MKITKIPAVQDLGIGALVATAATLFVFALLQKKLPERKLILSRLQKE